MPDIFFRESARLDALEAVDFLNQRKQGLGDRFSALLEIALQQLGRLPESAREIAPGIRRALVPTFRYRVLYTIETNRIVVIGIYHPSRSMDDFLA
ncbi:MAG: type II toxin-antitoxin system RelE/ParE family toxin [Planctomycetes bacterium]|jgi:hypothetical protein|nr:type II toxin-antitoxin system RelE/ParE family toxin [Planctomycetota bacterium]